MQKKVHSLDDVNSAIKTYLRTAEDAMVACEEALADNNHLLVHDLCTIAVSNLENVKFYAAKTVNDTNVFGGA